jgi:hypothetical protein
MRSCSGEPISWLRARPRRKGRPCIPELSGEKNIAVADPRIADLGSQGKTVIFVLIGD